MNSFQKKCSQRCEQLLRQANVQFSKPIRVDGRRETYFIIQFSLNSGNVVELFIYANEAGAMIDGKEWTIFEAPDFDSEEALIAAYAEHVAGLLRPS